MPIERILTYIKGLDRLIGGGLPKGSLTLVSGMPGTFKSILCMQTVYNNASRGKNTMFISLEQTVGDIKKQMEQFNWGFDKLDGNLELISIKTSDSDAVDKICNKTKKGRYELIALDSLTALTSSPIPIDKFQEYTMEKIAENVIPQLYESEDILRTKVGKIIDYIKRSGATALLISEIIKEPPPYSRDTVSEFMCDGVILLQDTGIAGERAINLTIKKMRFTKIIRGYYAIKIGEEGLEVEEETQDVMMK
jgi:circadian clock protein KaiC